MDFLTIAGAVGLARFAAKSIRKSEVRVQCRHCTEKNGKPTVTSHTIATDTEELKKMAENANRVGRTFIFAVQQSGFLEVINHIEDEFIYKCNQCDTLRSVQKKVCF